MYPDTVVICEKPLLGRYYLIVEILSPSTEEYDRGEKFYLYRSLSSFKEYVVVHQKHTLISVYFRLNEKDWRTEDAANLSETIHLQSINVTFQLLDIYRGIDRTIKVTESLNGVLLQQLRDKNKRIYH